MKDDSDIVNLQITKLQARYLAKILRKEAKVHRSASRKYHVQHDRDQKEDLENRAIMEDGLRWWLLLKAGDINEEDIDRRR